MFKFILHTLGNKFPQSFSTQNTMHESTLDAFEEKSNEEQAEEFAKEVERKCAELEITVDYYMMEFI